MQRWDSTPFTTLDDRTVKEEFDGYRTEVNAETKLYLVDLAVYDDLVTPEGYEGVYNVSGWSEHVLTFIEHAERPGGAQEVLQRGPLAVLHPRDNGARHSGTVGDLVGGQLLKLAPALQVRAEVALGTPDRARGRCAHDRQPPYRNDDSTESSVV